MVVGIGLPLALKSLDTKSPDPRSGVLLQKQMYRALNSF